MSSISFGSFLLGNGRKHRRSGKAFWKGLAAGAALGGALNDFVAHVLIDLYDRTLPLLTTFLGG